MKCYEYDPGECIHEISFFVTYEWVQLASHYITLESLIVTNSILSGPFICYEENDLL
jgi:hypothetical protein